MNSVLLRSITIFLAVAALAAFGLWWLRQPEVPTTPALMPSTPEAVLDRVAQRTLRESQAGADPIIDHAPPAPSQPERASQKGEVSLPEGYVLAAHLGAMQQAPLTEKPETEPAPNASWLEPAIGIQAILELPRSSAHGRVFAVVRIDTGEDMQAISKSLTGLGARVEGASGDSLRVRVTPERSLLEAIAALPSVLGIGAPPADAKRSAHFAAQMQASAPNASTPVFITLMHDDASGTSKRALAELGVTIGAYDADVRSYTANLPPHALNDVIAADYVMHVEPVSLVRATHASAVPVMGADGLRSYEYAGETFAGLTGRGIAIGVLDTGLNLRHPDITHGRESICGANFVRGERWDLWVDSDGHGTHVFGTIAGAGRLDPLRAGMAPNLSHLRFAKVLTRFGWGSDDDIRRGFDYLARPSACAGRPTDAVAPHIVNMSLGRTTDDSRGRAIGDRKLDAIVHRRGQLYVVAQSNDSARGFSNYGTAKNALAVGAVNDAGIIADFSSHGPTADGRLLPKVVGTGVDIWSVSGSASRDGYASLSGTSMAAPSVAGVAALVLEADGNLRNQSALVRARLMASAIRPDAYLESRTQFPLDNSEGPGAMQNQYGMGLVSARTSVASLPSGDGWQVASVESAPSASGYEYIDVRVPEGSSRLDVVLTWDEGPADTLTDSVLNNLDLWVDAGADCGGGACGEHASRSKIDNVEWLIVPAPAAGTHRIKVVPLRMYGEPSRAAVAWKIIQGASAPQLRITAKQVPSTTDIDRLTLKIDVETSSYLAAGTTLHFGCSHRAAHDCDGLASALEQATMRVIRQDRLVRDEHAGFELAYSLGEVAPQAPRQVEIEFSRQTLPTDTPLHVTASAWNARSAVRTILLDGASNASSPPVAANDSFDAARRIASEIGDTLVDFSIASREPGEPDVEGDTRSLWHIWQPPASGLYRFQFIREGSRQSGSARFDIYTGDKIAELVSVATKTGSEIAFTADVDTEYFIRASTSNGNTPRMALTWEAADVRPDNDDIVAASGIVGESGSIEGSNESATLERGEFWNGLAATTWHTWTAPATAHWHFALQQQNHRVMVFAGDSLDSLRLLSQPSPNFSASLYAKEGVTYRIAIAATSAEASGSEYTLSWRIENDRPPIAGRTPDRFIDARLLEGSEGSLPSPYKDQLTVDPEEPPESGIGTIWWQWTAPESGRFTFFIDGSDVLRLGLWTGARLQDLALQGANIAGTGVVLDAEAGQTYSVSIGRSPDSVNVPLSQLGDATVLTWGPTPENDDRAKATLITGSNGIDLVDLRHATHAHDDPSDHVGHESLWWHWSAPSSGWHTFRVDGDPDWAVLTIYPAVSTDGAAAHLVASSERSFLANGQVETALLARAGAQYQIRVAKRPNAKQLLPANLRWQQSSAPAYLGYRDAYDGPATDPHDEADSWTHNLAMHPDDMQVFATRNGQFVALDRDATTGELSNARSIAPSAVSINNDTHVPPPLNQRVLPRTTLWWSRIHDRLFAFHPEQSNAFARNAEGDTEWTRNHMRLKPDDSGGSLPVHNTFAATSHERFLYFADLESHQISAYQLDSEWSMTRVQQFGSIEEGSAEDSPARHIGEVSQMLVTPDDAYLIAADTRGLLVFSIDPETGRLTLANHIAVASDIEDTRLRNFGELGGVVLNADEGLLFVIGRRAPRLAVFDVSASYAEPLHLLSLYRFASEGSLAPTVLQRPSAEGFAECGRAYAHADLAAVDVICENGSFVARYDAAENSLHITDYALYPGEDRFGNEVPRHGHFRRYAAEDAQGNMLYRITQNGPRAEIHLMQRASAMTVDAFSNHAPSINRRLENQTATVGAAFRYEIPTDTFADADGDSLELTVSGRPPWLDFDAATRVLTGTPLAIDITAAPQVIEVTATDLQGAYATLRFGLEVVAAPAGTNRAPLVDNPLPVQTTRVGETFAFVIPSTTFSDPDGDALLYSVSGRPRWLDYAHATSTLTGTPSAQEDGMTFSLKVSAQDGKGGRTETDLTITVEAAPKIIDFTFGRETDVLSEWKHDTPVELGLDFAEALDRAQRLTLTSVGSAELGADFLLDETEVTVAAGSRGARFWLTPLLDFDSEGEETIILEALAEDGRSERVSLTIEDAGALFADAKSTLYSDLYVFFGDRTITASKIELGTIVCNLGARDNSRGVLQFRVSRSPSLRPTVGRIVSAKVPPISAGSCGMVSFDVNFRDLPASGAYYAVASISALPEEIPGRAHTNQDVTGFTVTSVRQARTSCPDLGRNTSPGTADPLASQQWHIGNTGQSAYAQAGGTSKEDLDMQTAISDGRDGAGVKVAVVDTGLEICHPDLAANVEAGASFNFNAEAWLGSAASDPYLPATAGDHGTSVAGLIASVHGNGIGGRGVAAGAKLRGYNFLETLDPGRAQAFKDSLGSSTARPNSSDVDIFNMSFGSLGAESITPDDDIQVFRHGTRNLRDGKGAIYVKAGGNGFGRCSSMQRIDSVSDFNINDELGCVPVNADRNTNLPYLINVGAFNASGRRASYSASGSALWVSAPAGEFGENTPAMITTDQMGTDTGYDALSAIAGTRNFGLKPGSQDNPHGDYVSTFNGTSSAAPNTSGAIAILLSAYPKLTWRDVKHLLAISARPIDPDIPAFTVAIGGAAATLRHAWMTNGAGYSFHNWYGFGAVSVDDLLEAAASHTADSLGPFTLMTTPERAEPVAIPDNRGAGVTQRIEVSDIEDSKRIESLTLAIKATHPFTNDLGIALTSPAGTESILLPVYSETLAGDVDLDWKLLSNAFYGESPNGEWTIRIIDAAAGDTGTLDSWQLEFAVGNVPEKR